MSKLLASYDARAVVGEAVTSSGSKLRVEYVLPSGEYNSGGSGFIAFYSTFAISIANGSSGDSSSSSSSSQQSSLSWPKAVIIPIVVVLCILLAVLFSVFFVCRQQLKQRRLRGSAGNLSASTPAHESLLGGSATEKKQRHRGGGGRQRGVEQKSKSRGKASAQQRDDEAADGSVDSPVLSIKSRTTTPQLMKKDQFSSSRSRVGPSPGSCRRSGGASDSYQLAPSSAAPMADDEDLSPSASSHAVFAVGGVGSQQQKDKKQQKAGERIRLESYGGGRVVGSATNDDETSLMLEKRPPVEGRDSLTRDANQCHDNNGEVEGIMSYNAELQKARYVPPTDASVASVRNLRSPRPPVQPLLLLPIGGERTGTSDQLQQLGSPASTDLSPLNKTRLFPDDDEDVDGLNRAGSPLSDIVADDGDMELEYDDYIPQLPGSYFTMDPQAYTLTWSKQTPWGVGGQQAPTDNTTSRTTSDVSGERMGQQYY
jgi:hypothetical protein